MLQRPVQLRASAFSPRRSSARSTAPLRQRPAPRLRTATRRPFRPNDNETRSSGDGNRNANGKVVPLVQPRDGPRTVWDVLTESAEAAEAAARKNSSGRGDSDGQVARSSGAAGQPVQQVQEQGEDPPAVAADAAEAARAESAGGGGDDADAAVPPTALSGEELIASAPTTPLILGRTLDEKADEIIARYRLMDDRLVAVEHTLRELARELRAAPAAPAAAAPAAGSSAGEAAGGAPAAHGAGATAGGGAAEAGAAGGGSSGAREGANGMALPPAASKGAAADSTPAEDVLGGGSGSQEGKKRLFELNRIQSAITEVANSGYLESVKSLRETLLVQEWGMAAKMWAQKRGVSAFEQWCAQHGDQDVSYDHITALYDDPAALHVLPTPRLRMMARAMIEQHTLQAYDETFKRCTVTAEALARVGLSDLLPHTAGIGQVLRGFLPGLSLKGWFKGITSVLKLPFRGK